jgi:hypothetical protein
MPALSKQPIFRHSSETVCGFVRSISSLNTLIRERPSSLPEKFQKPITHPNEAVLSPRKPKTQQPQRSPAARKDKKPSSKQRRERALSEAKKEA